MKFSGLIESKNAVDAKLLERIENKQRLNVSSHAYSILQHDIDVFQVEAERHSTTMTVLINHIFECFRDQAESSISSALQNRRIELTEKLSDMHDPTAREEAICLLLKSYAAELQKKREDRCKSKGEKITLRILHHNICFLLSEEGQQEASAYHDKVGAYIKAILEEYCDLPYVEREAIYFKKQKDEIDLAIQNKKLLRIVTRKQNISYVKPLELCQDKEHMYHYLLGFTSSSKDGPWKVASFRMSHISSCKRQAHSGVLAPEQKKEIQAAIAQTGIQYLSGSDTQQTIKVEFTSHGEKMYQQILHLRPQHIDHDGLIYEFDCSLKQAEDYFFKFGHNARILEPIHLAEKFRRKYHNAAKKYDSF